jgi:hypothetical protein
VGQFLALANRAYKRKARRREPAPSPLIVWKKHSVTPGNFKHLGALQ